MNSSPEECSFASRIPNIKKTADSAYSLECGFTCVCVHMDVSVCLSLSQESFCLQLCEYFTQSHVGFKGLSFFSSDIKYASTIFYILLKCFINSRLIYGLF